MDGVGGSRCLDDEGEEEDEEEELRLMLLLSAVVSDDAVLRATGEYLSRIS